jgi:hypothetical protein
MNTISSMYFGGGAFGCTYHIGVLSALETTHTIQTIYGCSAGAIIGLYYLLGFSSTDILNNYRNIKICDYDTLCISPLVSLNSDYPNAFEICNERLYIGTVSANEGFIWVNKFSSNHELFNAIMCSCHVPLLSCYNAKINGSCCIDGGFGIELKYIPNETISVSLCNGDGFTLRADMKVIEYLLPQDEATIQKYVNDGKCDMEYYITNGHSPVYNSLNRPLSSILYTSDVQMIFRLLQERLGGNTRELLF